LVKVNSIVEVAEYESVRVEDLLFRERKFGFSTLEKLILHPLALFDLDQPITEDTHIFVDPEPE